MTGLFGETLPDIDPTKGLHLTKGALMRRKLGTTPGRICRDCGHLHWNETRGGKRYSKCGLYGDSACTATDWNSRGPACGRFEERT